MTAETMELTVTEKCNELAVEVAKLRADVDRLVSERSARGNAPGDEDALRAEVRRQHQALQDFVDDAYGLQPSMTFDEIISFMSKRRCEERDSIERMTRERDAVQSELTTAKRALAAVRMTLTDLGVSGFEEAGGDLSVRIRALAKGLITQWHDALASLDAMRVQRDALDDAVLAADRREAALLVSCRSVSRRWRQMRDRALAAERERDEARNAEESTAAEHGDCGMAIEQLRRERDEALAQLKGFKSHEEQTHATIELCWKALGREQSAFHATPDAIRQVMAQGAEMRGALGDLVTAIACCTRPLSPSSAVTSAIRDAMIRGFAALAPDAGRQFAERMAALEAVAAAAAPLRVIRKRGYTDGEVVVGLEQHVMELAPRALAPVLCALVDALAALDKLDKAAAPGKDGIHA